MYQEAADSGNTAYYLGVQNNSTEQDASIVLRSGTITDGMKWKISKTVSGAYKLMPKTGEANNRVLAIENNLLYNNNGVKIRQRDYVQDDNFKDEWFIDKIDKCSITLCGISNLFHDHSSALQFVQKSLYDNGYTNSNLITGEVLPSDCKNYIQNSSIFTSRSHGAVSFLPETSILSATGIVLNDKKGSEMNILHSHPCQNMNAGSFYISNTDSFTNAEMVLFIGCNTAYGGNGANNLPTVVVNQGATVSVGFGNSIDCGQANEWTKDFYTHMLSGCTVQEAVSLASQNKSEASGLKSAIICGDGNYRLKN